jgi:glycerol-3-phosphate cytidylyltransferase-like family protein
VNNDEQVKIKTGKNDIFQDEQFRMRVVSALKVVDNAIFSIENKDYPNQTTLFQPIVDSIIHIVDLIKQKY